MIITFDEKDHVYTLNGEIADISVTQLLAKHGLGTEYGDVDKKTLSAARAYGNHVHKDLENVLAIEKYQPITTFGDQYLDWLYLNDLRGRPEQKLGIQWHGLLICGTADAMLYEKTVNKQVIVDHKTTASLNKEQVSWQVSILDYMARKLEFETINNVSLGWGTSKQQIEFYCLHCDKKTEKMTPVKLDKIPDSEIEKLFNAELNGKKYQRPALVISKINALDFEEAQAEMEYLTDRMKRAEDNIKKFREIFSREMEKQNVKSWVSPSGNYKVTYVPPTTQVRVDGKDLKKKFPDIYAMVAKPSLKSAYVLITSPKDEQKGEFENEQD